MPDIPHNAIRLADLSRKPNSSVPSSGHVVLKVKFLPETGLEGIGYLKYCDETYPPALAKYVVGISQLYRSSLGKRASEERLVYDSDGSIVGTVSVALNNFVPMQSTNDSTSADPAIEKLANPEPRTLIDEDIAELLVASWRHKEDDLHPGNLSTAGRLDYDMSWYHILSAIKGERIVCGTTQSTPAFGTALCEKDLHHFPVLESTRTHWPSQQPKNFNIRKAYKAQKSFSKLKDSQRFKEQMFSGLLKELLSFQPTTMQARLNAYLGDEQLELNSLPQEKRIALLSLANQGTFFKDDKHTIERGFADHFFRVSQAEYDSFYKVVVNYSEFKKFLVSHPEAFIEVKTFFETENKSLPVEQQYNLVQLDNMYQQIWRDTFIKRFILLLKQTSEEFEKIQSDIEIDSFLTADSSPTIISTDDASSASSSDAITPTKLVQNTAIDPANFQDEDTELKKIRSTIASLYSELFNTSHNYFEQQQATLETNAQFIVNCRQKLDESQQKIKAILNPAKSVAARERTHKGTQKLFSHWQTALDEIDYAKHLEKREETKLAPKIKYTATITAPPEQPATKILDSNIDIILKDALVDWLKAQPNLNEVILQANVALNEYSPKVKTGLMSYCNLWSYTRKRAPKLEKLLEKVKKEHHLSAIDLVIQIITEEGSGWEENSFNTLFMKVLLNKTLQHMTSNFESGSKYAALAIFKDAKTCADFNFYQHIFNVKEAFIDSLLRTHDHVPL